jgi:demethylmenaquinone methyltransferase/2-methoxy-6-polyprenyl-1,4-benzoquinol methylase
MPDTAEPTTKTSGGSLHGGNEIRRFFASIAKRYDLANHLLSAGCDFWWRRQCARLVAKWAPAKILDLACGSGDLALALAAACPAATIVGADFCAPMLEIARRKGVKHLVVADALRLPFAEAAFDAATVAFGLRNMESWTGALREMARVLRPGGRLLILDFSVPPPPLRWIYRPYLHRVLPLVADLVTGQRAVYRYLADSIEEFPSGQRMRDLLTESGLQPLEQIPLQGGIVTIHTAEKRPIA